MGATSGLYPAYAALVSDIVHGENVGGALGLVNTVTSLFGAGGALIGGYIANAFGYNTLYTLVFVFTATSLPPLLILHVDETREKRHQLSVPSFVDFLANNRNLLILCSVVFIITIGAFASHFYPDYVKARFGVGELEVAAFDSIYSIVWSVSNYPGGILFDKVGKKIVFLGYFLMGVAWLMFPILNQLIFIYAVYATYSLGNSLGYFTTTLALGSVPPTEKGTALGAMNTFMYMGIALSGLIGGFFWSILGTFISFMLAFISCTTSALLISLIKAK